MASTSDVGPPLSAPSTTGHNTSSSTPDQPDPLQVPITLFFVHGWQGTSRSFGRFPTLLTSEIQRRAGHMNMDIKVVQDYYKTYGKDISLDKVVRDCMKDLYDIPEERQIILICHSMGGIVAAEVLKKVRELENDCRAIALRNRIRGIMAFDTPFFGLHEDVHHRLYAELLVKPGRAALIGATRLWQPWIYDRWKPYENSPNLAPTLAFLTCLDDRELLNARMNEIHNEEVRFRCFYTCHTAEPRSGTFIHIDKEAEVHALWQRFVPIEYRRHLIPKPLARFLNHTSMFKAKWLVKTNLVEIVASALQNDGYLPQNRTE